MNIKLFSIFLLLAVTYSVQAAEPSGYRIFKSADGREMEARLTTVSGDDIFIERRDGLATKVDIGIFSPEDQEFIREWGVKHALRDGGLELVFKSNRSDKKEPSGRGSLLRTTWEEGYEVVIKNETGETIKDLKVDYLMLKFEESLSAKKRTDGEIKRKKGSVEINAIGAYAEASAYTERFPMLETELAPNVVWVDGGKQESEDEMKGVWVRISVDGTVVHEESRPTSMMRTETW